MKLINAGNMLFWAYYLTPITIITKPFSTTQLVVHALMLLFSEGVRFSSSEELTGLDAVVSYYADHLVEFGADLNAAGKATVWRVGCVVAQQPGLLERKGLIALLVPGVWDDDAALCACNTCCEEVNWNLVRLQLLISASALGKHPWNAVALDKI